MTTLAYSDLVALRDAVETAVSTSRSNLAAAKALASSLSLLATGNLPLQELLEQAARREAERQAESDEGDE